MSRDAGDGTPIPWPTRGPDVASGLRYGDVGGFTEFPPGGYAVSIRRTGSGPDTPPALSERILVPPGGAVTVALTGRFADLALEPLSEDLSPPPAGSARVRVLAAAAGAGRLDVSRADGPVLAAGLPFGGAGDPVAVPAGAAVLRVADGRGSVDVPADLAAGSIATVLVLDRPEGGLTLRVVLDAAAPAVVPRAGSRRAAGASPGPDWRSPHSRSRSAPSAGRRRFVVLTAARRGRSGPGPSDAPARPRHRAARGPGRARGRDPAGADPGAGAGRRDRCPAHRRRPGRDRRPRRAGRRRDGRLVRGRAGTGRARSGGAHRPRGRRRRARGVRPPRRGAVRRSGARRPGRRHHAALRRHARRAAPQGPRSRRRRSTGRRPDPNSG